MALNFPVIGLVVGVIWLSIDYLAADYFTELMNQYQIAPNKIHGMFLDSVHQYLAGASAVAIVLAVIVSYLLSNRVLRPLKEVSSAIAKMSAGDRDARAKTLSKDELGDLAKAFNLMAHQIKQEEKLRENMVVDVAHELRTPVTNIRGYVEGLRDQVITPDHHNLRVLEEEALRLGDLVESLLNLSRADAAEFSLKCQKVDIQQTIALAVSRHDDAIAKKSLEFNIVLPKEASTVLVDEEKFQIIINNLVSNACQYAPANTEIRIFSQHQSERIQMTFSNHSESITESDIPFVFERFYRSEKSRSRHSGGAGIGLAIVKKLVEAHGGHIGAHIDDNLFTVWFTIPASS